MKKLMVIALLVGFLSGCAETAPLKSPCNWSGTTCWSRTHINQWN